MNLIYYPENQLTPKGGPAGYLYNLKQGLDHIGVEDYDFLPASDNGHESNEKLRALVPKRIKDLRRLHRFLALLDAEAKQMVDFTRYDVVHFHSTEELYLNRRNLEDYKGVVVLTSHSPCAYHKELISRLNKTDIKHYAAALQRLEQIDEVAFRRADKIIFPCKEAEEPYFHTWNRYESVRDGSKYCFVPTGIQRCVAKEGRTEVRKRLGIPDSAFVLCYVGRHNVVKGYDSLIDMVIPLLSNSDVWMLVAGREGPISPPHHSQWVEVGWTNDPHSLIAACDLFVLPNLETYFDLVVLEVLSLGVPILASRTGGNKYFEQFQSRGFLLYETKDEFLHSVGQVRSLSKEAYANAVTDNLALYDSEFTCEKFAHRYCSCINEIAAEGA